MNIHKVLLPSLALAASALLLSACGDNNDAGPAASAPSTTSVADREITGNTSDNALPVSINDEGQVSDQDNSDSALPMAI